MKICPVRSGWTGHYKTILRGRIAFVADARFLGGQQFVSPGIPYRSRFSFMRWRKRIGAPTKSKACPT